MTKLVSDITALVFDPRRFFTKNAEGIREGRLFLQSVSFLAIAHWLSSLATFIWSMVFGEFVEERWNSAWRIAYDIMGDGREASMHQLEYFLTNVQPVLFSMFFGIIPLAFAPLFVFAKVLVFSLFVYAGVLLFMRRVAARPSFLTVLTVLCFAQTAWLMACIPIFGHLLSMLFAFACAVIGVSVVSRTNLTRAGFAVGFPYLLLLAGLAFFAALGVLFVFKLFPLVS